MLLFSTTLTVVVIGLAVGSMAWLWLRHWSHGRWSEFALVGVVGSAAGGEITEPLVGHPHLLDWRVIVASLGGTLLFTAIAGPIRRRRWASRDGRVGRQSVEELIAAGEGGSLEFKSSGRWNYRTSKRDDEIELVIAKTVAGLLNSDGGTLLIGVDDDGKVLGLDPDFQLLQRPDRDRYELWLRDLLARCLGQTNATLVSVSFAEVDDKDVCRVDVAPAPAPVFVDIPKGPRTADFYIRAGNSTRRLLTDEVLEYQTQHWASGRADARRRGDDRE